MIELGKAYRCFCPPDAIAAHNLAHKNHNSPPPPNPCIHLPAEESAERAAKGERHCVVFKASPQPTEIEDLVYGLFKRKLPENDFILRKTDGFPTYHFANIVDDHAMKITHVIRGAEWLVSTPKHVELYNALQWEPPAFAHVGLLVDPNRQKLSKRALGADLSSYRQERIIPAALLNFAALLGWSPGAVEDEVLTLQDMVQKVGQVICIHTFGRNIRLIFLQFRLRFTKGDIMVKLPGKLTHFDFAHKRRLLEEEPPDMPLLQEYVLAELEEGMGRYLSQQRSAYKHATAQDGEPHMTARAAAAYSPETGKIVKPGFFLDLLRIQTGKQKRTKPMSDIPSYRRHLIWQVPEPYLARTLRKRSPLDSVLGPKAAADGAASLRLPDTRSYGLISKALDLVSRDLEKIPAESWTRDHINPVAEKGTELWALLSAQLEAGAPPGTVEKRMEVAMPEIMRWALAGSDSAPSNKVLMEFLGREESLTRIRTAAGVAQKAAEQPDWQPEGFCWSEGGSG